MSFLFIMRCSRKRVHDDEHIGKQSEGLLIFPSMLAEGLNREQQQAANESVKPVRIEGCFSGSLETEFSQTRLGLHSS